MGWGLGMLNSIAFPNHRCFNTELADKIAQYRTASTARIPTFLPYRSATCRLVAICGLALLMSLILGRLQSVDTQLY
jgi:hypothetical protein